VEVTGLDMPNKMYPGTWVVVGLIIAIIVGAIGFMVYRWAKSSYVPWQPIYGYYPGSKWFSKLQGTDQKLIAEALQAAESCLIERTKWSAANLALVGHHVRVYVMDSEKWVDLWGRKVAGLQIEHTLVVGPSLAALCHEMAHLCEAVLDKEQDNAHATWAADGIAAAVDDFDVWLGKRGGADRVAAGIVPISSGKPLRKLEACRHRGAT
jgi:hypothetical protein